jgi:hypothetical protein
MEISLIRALEEVSKNFNSMQLIELYTRRIEQAGNELPPSGEQV